MESSGAFERRKPYLEKILELRLTEEELKSYPIEIQRLYAMHTYRDKQYKEDLENLLKYIDKKDLLVRNRIVAIEATVYGMVAIGLIDILLRVWR